MDKKALIVAVLISVSVSTLISGMFSFYFNKNSGGLPVDLATNTVNGGAVASRSNFQPVEPREILSVEGNISEIKDGKYIITTRNSMKVTAIVDSKTIYATSFPPSEDERKVLYDMSTSTGAVASPKLKLKVGDRIEATSKTNIKGKTEFVAEMIKLLR